MQRQIAALALGMGLLLPAALEGQDLVESEIAALRREVAELKAVLTKVTDRLQAVEDRLDGMVRLRREETLRGKLLFPIEVERAMLGEGQLRIQKLVAPLDQPIFQPRVP